MNDTIAAIASGMTASGIGIVRISGPGAFHVLAKIFRPKDRRDVTEYRANTIHYGRIVDENQSVIDECLVMIMRAPHTYTTEDTAEIDCHGGPYVMQRILNSVLSAGARLAEPGEFTKRAFLGGRIDLTEAEAVMDVISARSEDALKSSLRQLSGSLREEIVSLRETLLNELAYIEAALDDPEHYDLEGYPEELLAKLSPVTGRLKKLEKSFEEGRLVREGILTVILGKPNAGKSSLMNALTGGDRAIVTDIEGTTRDVLEEQVILEGLTLRVADTAGIRAARDQVEKIGIQKAREYAERADLVLAVFDASVPLDDNDLDILRMTAGRQAVIVLNKSDLEPATQEEALRDSFRRICPGESIPPVVTISARTCEGLPLLGETVRSLFFSGKLIFNEENVLTNGRHRDAVRRALDSLSLVRKSIEEQLPEDFYSIDLMDAYRTLGEIIGEEVEDDLVDTIFARFCMGK